MGLGPLALGRYIGQTQGTTALAAISLANLAGNLSAMSLIFGMLTAFDTLAPQALGRGDKREVGLLVQRGLLACAVMMPLVAAVWGNMETLLVMLGQPPE
jgi:Na+-driven multidrug efflux pump